LPEPVATILIGAGLVTPPDQKALGQAIADGLVQVDLNQLANLLTRLASGAGQLAGQMVQDTAATATTTALTPLLADLEDIAESALTAKLSDLWCSHRGWKPGEQPYHEAKALAYAVKAVVGAPFNPDPIAFVMASYHFGKSLLASMKATGRLVELASLAVAQGTLIASQHAAAVEASSPVDRWVAQSLEQSPSWASEERERSNDAFFDALAPRVSRRRS
jgi:hypothetical protein